MSSRAAAADAAETLVDLLRARATAQPERVAYVYVEDGVPDHPMTYVELDRRARAIAAALQGVASEGSRAVLLYPPTLDYVSAFFGCVYSRVMAVPAYPPDPSRLQRTLPRLQSIIADSRADVVLTTAPILAMAEMIFALAPELAKKRWIATDVLPTGAEDEWRDPAASAEDVAFLQYTSGSTGTPRGVVLSHRNLLHNLRGITRAFQVEPETVGVSWLPPYHDMGLIGGILAPMSRGCMTALMSPIAFLQRPLRWLQTISRFRGTISGGPNFAYELCLRKIAEEERAQLDLSSWTLAFSGAEPVRPETIDRFAQAFGASGFSRRAFYPCYGLAEATLFVSGGARDDEPVYRDVDAQALQHDRIRPATRGDASRTLVGCGAGLVDQAVVVVDPRQLRECADDEVGEIWVSGPSVARGYWEQPEETARVFGGRLDGHAGYFLRTGDLGFLHRGEVFVTGRLKDLVIIRGRNHYPQDIEGTAEESHGSIRRGCAGAFGIEVDGNEHVVVVVEVERRTVDRRRAPRAAAAGERRVTADRRQDDVTQPDHITRLWTIAEAPEPRPFDPDEVCSAVREAVLQHHDLHVYEVVLVQPGILPKTSSGKIQRRECRNAYLAGTLDNIASSVVRSVPSRRVTTLKPHQTREALARFTGEARVGYLAETLRDMVARSLTMDPSHIDPSRSVSTMGIDSMVAVELAHQVEKAFFVVVPVTWFLRGASIDGLARQLDELLVRDAPAHSPVQATSRSEPGQLSDGQRAMWFLHHVAPDPAAYNVHCALAFSTPLDAETLRKTLRFLVGKHTVLSSTYDVADGEPMARFTPGELPLGIERAPTREILERRLAEEAHRPFDLRRGPLFRAHAFTTGTDEHVLLLVAHHIVADLWSIMVLLREFGEVHSSFQLGRNVPVNAPVVSFADYVAWQQEAVAGPAGAAAWRHWSSLLASPPAALDLPYDRPPAAQRSMRGARFRFGLSSEEMEPLRRLAQVEGTTLYTVLLAGFVALLSRLTHQDDVTVGALAAGRSRAGFDDVVGYFVNPIVVRADLTSARTFRQLLDQVRTRLLDGLEHQDYPFAKLVERLSPTRDASRSPLFQTVFVLEKAQLDTTLPAVVLGAPDASTELGGMVARSVQVEGRTSQFDLTLSLVEDGKCLHGVVEYDTDLFDRSTIERFVAQYRVLLESGQQSPEQSLRAMPILPAAELEALGAWNHTASALPHAMVDELVDAVARERPDAVAVVSGDEQLTYAELCRRSDALAGDLARRGVTPGMTIAVCLQRRPSMIVALLGILKAGAAYLPLDPEYPWDRLRWMLADSATTLVLVDDTTAPLVRDLGAFSMLTVEEGASPKSYRAARPARDPGIPAYVLYTSGSTGRPKGVQVPHRALVALLRAMQERPLLGPGDVFLATTSLSFDIATMEVFLPLIAGGRVAIVDRDVARDPHQTQCVAAELGVTLMQATPSAWRMLVESGWTGRGIRVVTGGEPLPSDLAMALLERCEAVWNQYGPTETTIYSTAVRVRSGDNDIGGPISSTTAFVVDVDQNLVPFGVPGELLLGGAGVAIGYLGRPSATAERFVPDACSGVPGGRLYRTGDLVRRRLGGRLEYLGRMDQQVKIRGYRIELGEIESTLLAHPEVAAAAAVVTGNEASKAIVAHVVLAQDAQANWRDTLMNALRSSLPAHMLPSAIVTTDALPETPNGKIDRRELSRRGLGSIDTTGATPPRTPLERAIAAIWCSVLDRSEVGVDVSFFDLGGHSLLAARVAAETTRLLQVELPLRLLMGSPTIAGVAALIDASPQGEVARANAELLAEIDGLSDEEAGDLLGG